MCVTVSGEEKIAPSRTAAAGELEELRLSVLSPEIHRLGNFNFQHTERIIMFHRLWT